MGMGLMGMRRRIAAFMMAGATLLLVLLNACAPQKSLLDQVIASGELVALTRNAGTTYYQGPNGPTGLEYDLLERFANFLNVKLTLVTTDDLKTMLNKVSNGDVNVAAAGLTVTPDRKEKVRFSSPYQYITQQIVYNQSGTKPKTLTDLTNTKLEIVANSSHAERLKELKSTWLNLDWNENSISGTTELMSRVAENTIDYTIVDSNELAHHRRYHPELRVAFDISQPQALAWAFKRGEDESLFKKAELFFSNLKASGELDRLIKRHTTYVQNYDYAGTYIYMNHVNSRLPLYKDLFTAAAKKYKLKWPLLAAMAYQESHWRPDAVSPTGVRGIMMLTQVTANQLGVTSRTDVEESIFGGAQYLRELIDRFPSHIKQPDRTWLALAAYNVGYGHVRDAQIITEMRGGDPDKWSDIKENLPLLRRKEWYKQTRYGYARGNEPVRYVENIRSYHDILRWQIEQIRPSNVSPSILAFASPVL